MSVGLRLLGPVEVWAGPVQVEVGSARVRLLLAALAVDAGRVVPVDVLVARLWGHELQCGRPVSTRMWMRMWMAVAG